MDLAYEMKLLSSSGLEDNQPSGPEILSVRSSIAALRVAGSTEDSVNVQELPPVDRGLKAWTFCASGFVLEMMIWGFGFRFAVLKAGLSLYECADERRL